MPSITVREVAAEVHAELVVRAARAGRSLQEYLRAELTQLAARPDPAELHRRIVERKRRLAPRLAADEILRHRDHDRR